MVAKRRWRVLSDVTDAPLLGEAALLYTLSQPPGPGFPRSERAQHGYVPGVVRLILIAQIVFGALGCALAIRTLKRAVRR